MTSFGVLAGRTLVTGHGTENDFVLVPDPDGELTITPSEVAAVCDRHAGVGGDGLIRVVRSGALTAGADLLAEHPDAEWFMDYRNADGSYAEMCGNGVRVFVHYLRTAGLIDLDDGGSVVVGTRGGARRVTREGEQYTADMGRWWLPGAEQAAAQGHDVVVDIPGLDGPRGGLRIAVPNPHVVVALPDEASLAAAHLILDGASQPTYEPVPPEGTNLELVVPLGENVDDGSVVGAVRMRVLERGVGETRSCGTGTCAAALAVRTWGGAGSPDTWRVLVPGGEVRVRVDGDRVLLTGSAELTADVVLRD
ncbi:diaminopimelate epimerase [Georgenia halophila]|uniref:Diaminopimelate epimerase n=1 Tax=Georgenia halophila TaxID=620889 RepID=A0ABP8L7G7_9MICO